MVAASRRLLVDAEQAGSCRDEPDATCPEKQSSGDDEGHVRQVLADALVFSGHTRVRLTRAHTLLSLGPNLVCRSEVLPGIFTQRENGFLLVH